MRSREARQQSAEEPAKTECRDNAMNEMTDIEAELIALETELLGPETRGEPRRLHHLIGEEFVEFSASGRIYDKQSVIAGLLNEAAFPEAVPVRTPAEFRVRLLSDTAALVTYTVSHTGKDGDGSTVRASVWTRRPSGWQIIFHQGTRRA